MLFHDRYDAAMKLTPLLEKYKGREGVTLAVQSGGVPIGYYLAKYPGFLLNLLMTKKIGYPANEEFAVGSVGMEDNIVEDLHGNPESYSQQ